VIAVSRRDQRVRIALLADEVLREFWIWDLARPDGIGDVYTGRIEAVMPALAGRFVELGGLSGFLPDSAGGKTLSEGTFATFTVTRAAQNDKGPRLAVAGDAPADRPGLLRRGPGPLLALCARHPAETIRLDDYALIAALRPALEGRMHFDAAAFDPVLEDEVAALCEFSAPLPLGAVMHITPAPAATLIDIDSKAASGVSALALNTAILPEIARQIVLRNLSGGILIDFAGMKPAARAKLAAPLRAALAADPLKPELLGFSHLGFAEVTRRRIRPPLHEALTR
jgi:ribonuclease G